MKDIIKYISLFILIVFSFYYTDKISTMIIYKSDLMKEIISHKDAEEIKSVNGIIDGDYITPGINGLKVNELDSYYQMKKSYVYSRNKLIFDEVEPKISLESNKHLVINRANKQKKAVAIIVENNDIFLEYLKEQNLEISLLITNIDFKENNFFEQLNDDYEEFDALEKKLNKSKMNTNICIVNSNNKDICKENNKYLVEPTYYVNNVSIIGLEINSGDIIYVSKETSLSNLRLLLKKIYYRNLDIKYLSELISEKRQTI